MSGARILTSSPAAYRAFALDNVVAPSVRKAVIVIGLSILGLATLAYSLEFSLPTAYQFIPPRIALGVFAISLGAVLPFLFLEFFYRSSLVAEPAYAVEDEIFSLSVEGARVLYGADGDPLGGTTTASSILRSFASTELASILSTRLGVSPEDIRGFAGGVRLPVRITNGALFEHAVADVKKTVGGNTVRVGNILVAIATLDAEFGKFLFDRKVLKDDLGDAAEWIESVFETEIAQLRWWDRERLARIPGIGKDLGYGYTFTLDRFSREITGGGVRFARETRKQEIRALEDSLSRSYESNVLLVGEEGAGKHAVLEGLADSIRMGIVQPALEHKRMIILDYGSMSAVAKTKGDYEALTIRILNEIQAAGNILLVIESLSGFLSSSLALGVDVLSLFEPYLSSTRMQVIALSDREAFHRDLEPSGKVMKLFEKIEIEEPNEARTLRMLEDAALRVEALAGKFFTFQSLKHALTLAEKYVTEGAMPEKAIDLLDEVASSIAKDRVLIMPEDIEAVVEKKTHIPTTKAQEEEKDKLLNMEQLLHERMIDQEDAVRAISDALRRARSGLKVGTRPIGTFLFLGPTGVGKTETAKALADVYFGDEEAMFRFDMSEYAGPDAVEKLIGERDSKDPGALTTRLRERPFSLLLFDEFEKATKPVHNLFLQILDEGFFSDGHGKRVSARETMIIMTSNAGASLLWDLMKEDKDLTKAKQAIIDKIRAEGAFSPELMNRFDEIVIYKPLSKENLEKVAMLMLKGLKKRLAEQEIIFEPTPELARKVVDIGYDQQFGARPMRRAIADRVEQVIAKKILGGELKRGDTFSFTSEDIAKL